LTAYFVTGATGFIGRHLVERLLEREGDIHVLVREGSREKLDALIEGWGQPDRIKPVVGDLGEHKLGVEYEGDHHRGRGAFQADLRRINALRACGWTVLRFAARDLREPARLIATVKAALTGVSG